MIRQPLKTKNFYKDLKPLNLPLAEIFTKENFCDAPQDWHVVVADIQNSTAAVVSGKHNDVNLVAAGSLIAVLNIARQQNIEIPFFFGGDGGTMLVPEYILQPVLGGLFIHNFNSRKTFGLNMHIGSVCLKDIIRAGHSIKIAKVQSGKGLPKAIVIGDGLIYAEQQIKSLATIDNRPATDELILTGLECRWNKVKPPFDENEIVCYLIESLDPTRQLEVFSDVLKKMDEIYGNLEIRNPLSLERLKLLLDVQKTKKEMLVKYGQWKIGYFITTLFQNFLGPLFFKYNLKFDGIGGRDYLSQLVSNADTLTIDGRINTIISGKRDKRLQFLKYLSALEKEGVLIYGHHISKECVMTCYIENRNAKHIHFVDGSDGGYTEAAKEFKSKLKSIK